MAEARRRLAARVPRVEGGCVMARPKSTPARDGDKDQARQTVNGQVRYGERPHPNQLPCFKCGHVWTKEGGKRHEYDHHKGYDAAHHEDVISLCTDCHHGETDSRAEAEASKFAKALMSTAPTLQGGEPSDKRTIVYVPLRLLAGAVRNVKKHDIPGTIASIKRFGFNDAVIVDERTGRLVAGHGRVEALLTMHAEKPDHFPRGIEYRAALGRPMSESDWLVPVQRGWASKNDVEAEAFIVAANALGARAGFDTGGLEEVLADLKAADALEGTGYSRDDVDALLRTSSKRRRSPSFRSANEPRWSRSRSPSAAHRVRSCAMRCVSPARPATGPATRTATATPSRTCAGRSSN